DKLLKEDERADIVADLSPAALIDETHVDARGGETPARRGTTTEAGAALILYTSGSTGRPKGAVLSHAALEAAIESWAGPVMALTPEDVVLATLPLAHSFGLNGALLAPLLVGATVALAERFRPISYRAADPTESPDSIGWPVPGVEIRVVDDAGRSVTTGEPGELWIRSPSAMDFYINAPDETREVLVDGWFRTGDLATVS